MKMVWAIIRPEMVDKVAKDLGAAGYPAFTRFDVYGRGKQDGVMIKKEIYDMPKTTLMLVLEDECVDEVVGIINETARTGNTGDGRIFVTAVEKAYTIRTGDIGL